MTWKGKYLRLGQCCFKTRPTRDHLPALHFHLDQTFSRFELPGEYVADDRDEHHENRKEPVHVND